MKNITNPKINTQIIFGILSMIILVFYVWNFSFVWDFAFGVNHYIILLLILLAVGFLFVVYIDRKKQTKLKNYFIISISQLLVIGLVSNPIREWQIEKTKEQGIQIIKLIDEYKLKKGEYPKSLAELQDKLNIDFSKRTKIGTNYFYEIYNRRHYNLGFKSYYGYHYNYDKQNKNWFVTD